MVSENAILSLVAHTPPTRNRGLFGNGKQEMNLAGKVARGLGESRFSPVIFGRYLYDCANSEEINNILVAMVSFINMVAQESERDMTPIDSLENQARGYMAMRIIDSLSAYGYINQDGGGNG